MGLFSSIKFSASCLCPPRRLRLPAAGTIALTAGQKYDIKVEYASRGRGGARMQLLWSAPGMNKQLVPTSALFPDSTVALPTGALTGSYYLGGDFNTPIMTRADSVIDFNWYRGTPDQVIPPHKSFSVRWLGEITAPTTGVYSFKTVTDDGVKLWVNGILLINSFHVNSGHPNYASIALQAGQTYALRMDYFENGSGVALAKLLWALPGHHTFTSFTPFTAPVPLPAAVTASAGIAGYTDGVDWTASPAATSYLVERSLDGLTGWLSIADTTGTHISENGLPAGETLYYRVTAANATGSSAPSNIVNVTTPPATPTGLTATTASPSEIDLHWNDVRGETGFLVFESANGTSGWSQVATVGMGTTSFPVSGLSPSTTYYFAVEAVATNAVGNAGLSNIASATTSVANPTYAALTTMYGLTGNGKVYSLDTTTGAAAQIGTLSFGTNAAGRDPYTSNFYYISTGTSTVAISAWNPFDGSNTVVAASVPLSGAVAEAAFATDGTFFFTTDVGDIYAFNTDTNVATLKGNIHANGVTLNTGNGDIAFAPDGTLYLETSSELYSIPRGLIDIGSGTGSIITATDTGSTGGNNLQLAFGQNGILFGTDASGQLYSINPATGATTPIGVPTGIDMGDLASVPLESDLTASQSASSFAKGSNGTYSLTVSNAGPDTNVGPITLVDTIPTGVTFVNGTGTGWTFSVSGQIVTMTYTATLASAASAPAVTLNVAIATGVASSVTNSVTVSSSIFETDTSNDSSSINTLVSG